MRDTLRLFTGASQSGRRQPRGLLVGNIHWQEDKIHRSCTSSLGGKVV